MIAIVDYGAGNLRSVAKAVEKLGYSPEVTGDPQKVLTARAVILPGVGASDSAMTALEERGLVEPLRAGHPGRCALLRGLPGGCSCCLSRRKRGRYHA